MAKPTTTDVVQALHAACAKVAREVPPAAARHHTAAAGAIDAAQALARSARKAQSNPALRAVKPDDPATHVDDVTAKFRAFKLI